MFCLDISCILILLICRLAVYLNQGTCIFNPLIFFFLSWDRESFEVFYCGCIFRKVKLALYTETVILREVEVDSQEAVFASLLSVISDEVMHQNLSLFQA